MKLSTKYILFITLIHLTALVLSFFIFKEYKLLFLGAEVVLLLSLYFSYRLYRSLVSPIELISTGVDAMADRDFSVKFQKVGQAELDHLIEIYNKMIDQLRMERTQKIQKHFFLEKLIHTSPTGIIILDLDQKISACNPKAVSIFQQQEATLLGKSFQEIDHPLSEAIALLRSDSTQTIQIDGIETFKCHKAHFIDRGFQNYFILIEELTAEKLQIEKQAYGKVIRMMAHEVNNSIGPINSILESLDYYTNSLSEGDQPEFVHALQIARDRNQKLNQFMRNFADVVRLPPPEIAAVNICKATEHLVDLMRHQVQGKTIHFNLEHPPNSVVIQADEKQLEQVLINVIKNAIEAIEQDGQIRLIIQNKPASICILDNGTGIPAEKSKQIFSPFFSTKPQGQGVGLTLCREILLNHGFKFSLKTEEDGWTKFEILF